MKKKLNIHILILLALGMVFMASCKRIVVRLDAIPENTPKGQTLYVTGNFNNWDPGDENYQLTLEDDSNYYVTLPPGLGIVEYKFTRGDWTSVEENICGEEIRNRTLNLSETDTITTNIGSWSDLDPINCTKLTIKLKNIPENTPLEDIIAIASNLNSWDPDNASVFVKDRYGDLYVTIHRPADVGILEYKITRGDLSTSESDELGNYLPNRILEFGKKDTVSLNIQGWIDQPEGKSKRVVLIIKTIPKNTPEYDNIYFASNLNSWTPHDKNYQFQKNSRGQLFYTFPRKKLLLDYKITRGNWGTVEVDYNGYDIANRTIDLMNADTVYIDIKRWNDIDGSFDDKITVILKEIPKSTSDHDNIFITGNFNNWNPGKLRQMFNRDKYGNYFINLPRKSGDFEFKITRGSMESTQVDKYGSEILPNKYAYSDFDTLFIDVENWKDLPLKHSKNITLVINQMPNNTPDDAVIFLAPDFNGWNPEDLSLTFDNLDDGRFALTIPANGKSLNYKITRGGWKTVEVNKLGDEIPDRILHYGFADTVFIDIFKWRDLDGNY